MCKIDFSKLVKPKHAESEDDTFTQIESTCDGCTDEIRTALHLKEVCPEMKVYLEISDQLHFKMTVKDESGKVVV